MVAVDNGFVFVGDTYDERPEKIKPPSFIVEPHTLSARVGERAIFEAQAAGHPMPNIRW